MRDVTFRDQEEGYGWFYAPSYDELIDSFEVNVLFSEHDDDYQGDSYYLLSNGSQFGILIFGWGSCSGCDALEGCDSEAEVTELRDDLWNSIVWRSEEEIIEYIKTNDWEGQWYVSYGAGQTFVNGLFDWFDIEREVQVHDPDADEW